MFQHYLTTRVSLPTLSPRLLGLLCIVFASYSASPVVARSVSPFQFQDEHSLLAAAVAAKTAEESRVLLRSHKKLLTEKLWAMLKEDIDKNLTAEAYPRALFLAEIGRQIAEELQNRRWITLILNRIAYIHLMLGDYQKASENGMQCLAAMDGLDDNLILANVLLTIGVSALKQGDYTSSLGYLQKALTSAASLPDKTYAADALVNLGHVYTRTGNYIKALFHYNQAIALISRFKDSGRMQDALSELSILYAEQGDYEKAIDYLNQSLKIAKETGDQRGIASILITTGIVYREQDDIGIALQNLEEGLKISEENRFTDLVSYSRTACASVYKLQGKYEVALAYFRKSLDNAEQTGDRRLQAGTFCHLADLCNTTKDYSRALEYANEAVAICSQITLPEISYLALTEKGKAHQGLNQLDLA